MSNFILIKGANQHNLKKIDINIPKNKLVVITGVSGSGKSSLAFDTIYAEGQRRYVESLSTYARQFLEMHNKPDIESIEGLSPAIAINQKTISKNPRSTVATSTEVYDYLRVLFARVGVLISPATGLPIKKRSAKEIVDSLMKLPIGAEITLLAPIVCGQKGEHRRELLYFKRLGYEKLKIDGINHEFDSLPCINKNERHDIDLVVDKVKILNDTRERITESVESIMLLSKGLLKIEIASIPKQHKNSTLKDKETIVFSEKFSCPVSGFSLPEIEPRIFSFNSPYGACTKCNGLGKSMCFDEDLIVPDKLLSIKDGAIMPWKKKESKYSSAQSKIYDDIFESLARHYAFDLDAPFGQLKDKIKKILIYGSGDESIKFSYQDGYKQSIISKPFLGVIPMLEERIRKTESNYVIDELLKFQVRIDCNECKGFRIKKESLNVKIDGCHIGNITRLSINEAYQWVTNLKNKLGLTQIKISSLILKELEKRLSFLINVGLNYLTLDRTSSTLSGGENQRIKLASQIGSSLTGVLYVLDEPSIGLHQSDNDKLINSLKKLRDLGNSIIVVEHDEDTMKQSDYIIDIGKYAGIHGGRVVSHGSPITVSKDEESLTGKYISGKLSIPIPKRRTINLKKLLCINNVTTNNLKNISIQLPVSNFIAITGVSGSGKSSLILQTLYGAVMNKLHNCKKRCGEYKSITGLENIDKIIEIDQQPIGRTPRSNPATYTGVFTPIRDWFASLKESKLRGYLPGRFSFNVKGGRCEICEGDGLLKIEMHFLPDVYVKCDECNGKRYNNETLQIRYNGKTIADVLSMTINEGLEFFKHLPIISDKLKSLSSVGLGYVSIGQSATTLSGGEAQRVKLAKELSKKSTGRTLYILDEPTTGLHSYDIQNLLRVLHALVDMCNTVIVIEHNLDVIKTADYVIDIGPQGGEKGGELIAHGTPESISKNPRSVTGKYLIKKMKKVRK